MNAEQIIEVLGQLDPEDDTHWNASGQPMMTAVCKIAKGPLKREDLDAVASHYDRTFARDLAAKKAATDDAGADQENQSASANANPDPSTDPDSNDDPDDPDDEDENQEPHVDPHAEWFANRGVNAVDEQEINPADTNAQLTALQEEYERLNGERAELHNKILEATGIRNQYDSELSVISGRMDQLRGTRTTQDDIKDYLDRQRQIREEKAARATELRESGLDVNALQLAAAGGKSALDQAMNRRGAKIGSTRPQFTGNTAG